jgi:hypothetical protein
VIAATPNAPNLREGRFVEWRKIPRAVGGGEGVPAVKCLAPIATTSTTGLPNQAAAANKWVAESTALALEGRP